MTTRDNAQLELFDEPVFVRHPPVINHSAAKWHHSVPFPYRFKIDGPWIFVLLLAVGGVVFKPLLLIAAFIAILRCLVWLCWRFPLTTYFFVSVVRNLMGGRRRRRW